MRVKLPDYMQVKQLKGGPAYYWVPSKKLRESLNRDGDPFPFSSETLPRDLGAAISRAEAMNALVNEWREAVATKAIIPDSISALFVAFRKDHRFERLAASTKENYERGLALVENHLLDNGLRLGDRQAAAITPSHADAIYGRLQIRADGQERLTVANDAMKATRRAWSVGIRRGLVKSNPWREMGLTSAEGGRWPVPREMVYQHAKQAEDMGYPSIALADVLAFELCQRPGDVLGTISWAGYRNAHLGPEIRVKQAKTGQWIWLPLFDDEGELYPGLVDRVDAAPRRGTLMVMRDNPDPKRGEYLPHTGRTFARIWRKIADEAGLPKKATFHGFRHGGLQESGDAGATDREMIAASGHTDGRTLKVYSRASSEQARNLARKRRAWVQAGTKVG